jgi:hypothetical protein
MPVWKCIIRDLLIFVGALVLGEIVVGSTILLVHFERLSHKDPKLDQESHLYADAAIVEVVKDWSEDALMKRGSIELTASARNEIDLDAVFERWRALGPMVKYDGSKGAASVAFSSETGQIVSALYLARASFQHGTAQIKIGLVKRGVWQVASFQVFPSILAAPPRIPPPIKELNSPFEPKPGLRMAA